MVTAGPAPRPAALNEPGAVPAFHLGVAKTAMALEFADD
jgi:hypothetical protein